MDNGFIVIVCLFLVSLGLYYFFFSKDAVVSGVISRTGFKKIADVTDGEEVSVQGKVIYAGKVIFAPLSHRKCVYYHVIVKDSSHHREVFKNHIDLDEERGVEVVIQDGDHYAVIDTKSVASAIAADQHYSSGFFNITSDELRVFLKKHGERTEDYAGWSLDLTASEGLIEEGETLSVAGKAKWRNASDFKLNIPDKKVLYISPLNEHGVYMTDDPTVKLKKGKPK